MVQLNGKKYACETCIKGHRSSSCQHNDRALYEIKPKGRPVSQCQHCRELRKTKQVHVKCECDPKMLAAKAASSKGAQASQAAGPSGRQSLIAGGKGTKKPKTFELSQAAFPNGIPDLVEGAALLTTLSNGDTSDAYSPGPPTPENGNPIAPTITGQCACDGTPADELCRCCTPRYKPKPRAPHSGQLLEATSSGERRPHILPTLSVSIPTSRPPSNLTTPIDSAGTNLNSAISPSSVTSPRHHASDGHQVGATQTNHHSRHAALYLPYPTSSGSGSHHRSPRLSVDHQSLHSQIQFQPPTIGVSDGSGFSRSPEGMDIDGTGMFERPGSSLSIRGHGSNAGDGGLDNVIGASRRHNSSPTDPGGHRGSLGLLTPDWVAGSGSNSQGLSDHSISDLGGGAHNNTMAAAEAMRMLQSTDANSPSSYGGASPYPSENGRGDSSPLLPISRSLTPLQTMLQGLSPQSPTHDGTQPFSPSHSGSSPYHHPTFAKSSEALSPIITHGDGGHEDDESVLERASAALRSRSKSGRVGHSRSRSRGQSPIPPRNGHSSPSHRRSMSGASSPAPLNTNVGAFGQFTQSPISPMNGGGLSPSSSHISPTSQQANNLGFSPNGHSPLDINALLGTGSLQQQHQPHNQAHTNTAKDCAEGMCTCSWHQHGGNQCAEAGDQCGCCDAQPSSNLAIPGVSSPPNQSRGPSRNRSRRNSSLGGTMPPPNLGSLEALSAPPHGPTLHTLLQEFAASQENYGVGVANGSNDAVESARRLGFTMSTNGGEGATSDPLQQTQNKSLTSLVQPIVTNQGPNHNAEFLAAVNVAASLNRSRSSSSASLPTTPVADHAPSSMYSDGGVINNGKEQSSPVTSPLSRSNSARTSQYKSIRPKPIRTVHHPTFAHPPPSIPQNFNFPGKQNIQFQGPGMISTDVRAVASTPSPGEALSALMFTGLAITQDSYSIGMSELGMSGHNPQAQATRHNMTSDQASQTSSSTASPSSPYPPASHVQAQLPPAFTANIIDPSNRMTMTTSNGTAHHISNHTRSASYSHEGNPHPPNAGHSRSTSYDHNHSRSPSPFHGFVSSGPLGGHTFANLTGSSYLHPSSAANIEVIITPASPFGAGASAGS